MYTLYGIPNCNTIKKARSWFENHGLEYHFYNYKTNPISTQQLKRWSAKFGWERLLNKQGTTWRKLSAADQVAIVNEETAFAILKAYPSIVKRPIIEKDQIPITLGFDPTQYEQLFL